LAMSVAASATVWSSDRQKTLRDIA